MRRVAAAVLLSGPRLPCCFSTEPDDFQGLEFQQTQPFRNRAMPGWARTLRTSSNSSITVSIWPFVPSVKDYQVYLVPIL